jgi:hypothetical protein
MHKLLFSIAAAAIALSSGAFGTSAAAMPRAAPLSAAPASIIKQAAMVCGSGGCFAVQTKRVTHPKPLHASTSTPTH